MEIILTVDRRHSNRLKSFGAVEPCYDGRRRLHKIIDGDARKWACAIMDACLMVREGTCRYILARRDGVFHHYDVVIRHTIVATFTTRGGRNA